MRKYIYEQFVYFIFYTLCFCLLPIWILYMSFCCLWCMIEVTCGVAVGIEIHSAMQLHEFTSSTVGNQHQYSAKMLHTDFSKETSPKFVPSKRDSECRM